MTTVRIVRGGGADTKADLVVVPVTADDWRSVLRSLGRLSAALERRARAQGFSGKGDEALLHPGDAGDVLVLGLGPDRGDADAWRRAGARARREGERLGSRRVAAWIGTQAPPAGAVAAFAEGALLAGYRFDRYRRESRPAKVATFAIVGGEAPAPAEARRAAARVATLAARVAAARDLVNEPPSVATPRFVAGWADALAKGIPGLGCEVWGPKVLEKEGLAGLVAVSRGTREEPRFVTLRWSPPTATRQVAIVGKGITFDSGGLSLKPPKSMETMKYDMAGAAAVLNATAAAAALGLPVGVTAYVPLAENLPGGAAQKPGDVIRYANGTSVEVLNTDAEGRLVLADALILASRETPDAIVDVATLTGAARVALGSLYAALLGTDRHLLDALVAASRASGEAVWELPLVREYREDIKSTIADVKNVGGDAGTITAALFLREFVAGVPWAHLDIAGPAFAERDHALGPRGATGYGVRLLVHWLERVAVPG